MQLCLYHRAAMPWLGALHRLNEGLRTEGFLLLCAAGLAVTAIVAMGALALLVGIWLAGGVDTAGDNVDWAVVSALGTVAIAIATSGTAAALFFAAFEFDRRSREFRTQLESERIAHHPYIRADVALLEVHEPNLNLPATHHIYEPTELGNNTGVHKVAKGLSSDSGDAYSLVLWMRNLQREPLGIADGLEVRMSIVWGPRNATEFEEQTLELTVAYLAPDQVTAVRLAEVDSSLRIFTEIVDVKYHNMFGERSRDCHGAMLMTYDPTAGVRNERKVQRPERIE